MTYMQDDLQIDIEWLNSYGVEKPEAFLRYIIKESGGKIL